MGGLARGSRRALLLASALAALTAGGCASSPESGPARDTRAATDGTEAPEGVYHTVRPGENIYRISLRYGVAVNAVIRANRIRDVRNVQVGTRLWIPDGRFNGEQPPASPAATPAALTPSDARARLLRESKLAFRWPLRGKLNSRFGQRNGRAHQGIDLSARRGTKIRAAEAGVVTHSGAGLRDYGRVVILKHTGHYASVYAHTHRNFVKRGEFVERGDVIAEVGSSGNASGNHLHFEIRVNDQPTDPLLYLP